MASRPELVVNLEDPHVHVKVVDYESGQRQLEFSAVLNVVGTHGDRDIADLEDSLGTTLCRVDDIASCGVWLSTEDGYAKLNRQLDIILSDFSGDDVSRLAVDEILDLAQSFRGVQ